MKKPHTSTDYEPGQHISHKLQSISWPIEKMLYCENQALKNSDKKNYIKIVRLKKESYCYKNKFSPFCCV